MCRICVNVMISPKPGVYVGAVCADWRLQLARPRAHRTQAIKALLRNISRSHFSGIEIQYAAQIEISMARYEVLAAERRKNVATAEGRGLYDSGQHEPR